MPRPLILERAAAAGFATFETGQLNLNLIGVRSGVRRAGAFDDVLHVVYKRAGAWVEHRFAITTDPGSRALAAPQVSTGAAILVPGQYRGAWEVGLHQGRESHPALVQRKPVTVWRDNDKDAELDPGNATSGLFGINIHAPSHEPLVRVVELEDVGLWGSGCQVFASTLSYRLFWGLVQEAASAWGPKFTYSLLAED